MIEVRIRKTLSYIEGYIQCNSRLILEGALCSDIFYLGLLACNLNIYWAHATFNEFSIWGLFWGLLNSVFSYKKAYESVKWIPCFTSETSYKLRLSGKRSGRPEGIRAPVLRNVKTAL